MGEVLCYFHEHMQTLAFLSITSTHGVVHRERASRRVVRPLLAAAEMKGDDWCSAFRTANATRLTGLTYTAGDGTVASFKKILMKRVISH
jgi:hypothetical protein